MFGVSAPAQEGQNRGDQRAAFEDVTIIACVIGSEIGFLAWRETEDGRLEALGGLKGARIERNGRRVLVSIDANVFQVVEDKLAALVNGEAKSGNCEHAEGMIRDIVEDVLSDMPSSKAEQRP